MRLPASVIDAIWTTAGTIGGSGEMITDPHVSTLGVFAALAVAQIATPGDEATPVTRPVVDTLAAAPPLVHVTVGLIPASALTTAVSVTVWPTLIVAVGGETTTLVMRAAGCTTFTFSPHAAANIAAPERSDERKTLTTNPLRVKNARDFQQEKYTMVRRKSVCPCATRLTIEMERNDRH